MLESIFGKLTPILDWVTSFWDRLVQSAVFNFIFGTIQWIDWLCVVFILFGFAVGFRKGIARMLLWLMQIVASLYITFENYKAVAAIYMEYLGSIPRETMLLISYVSLAGTCLFGFGLVAKLIGSILPEQAATPFKSIISSVLGVLSSLLLLSFLTTALVVGPWEAPQKALQGGASYTGGPISRVVPTIHEWIGSPLKVLKKRTG